MTSYLASRVFASYKHAEGRLTNFSRQCCKNARVCVCSPCSSHHYWSVDCALKYVCLCVCTSVCVAEGERGSSKGRRARGGQTRIRIRYEHAWKDRWIGRDCALRRTRFAIRKTNLLRSEGEQSKTKAPASQKGLSKLPVSPLLPLTNSMRCKHGPAFVALYPGLVLLSKVGAGLHSLIGSFTTRYPATGGSVCAGICVSACFI